MRQGKEGGCKCTFSSKLRTPPPGGPLQSNPSGEFCGAVDNMHLTPSRPEQTGTRGGPHQLTGSVIIGRAYCPRKQDQL